MLCLSLKNISALLVKRLPLFCWRTRCVRKKSDKQRYQERSATGSFMKLYDWKSLRQDLQWKLFIIDKFWKERNNGLSRKSLQIKKNWWIFRTKRQVWKLSSIATRNNLLGSWRMTWLSKKLNYKMSEWQLCTCMSLSYATWFQNSMQSEWECGGGPIRNTLLTRKSWI